MSGRACTLCPDSGCKQDSCCAEPGCKINEKFVTCVRKHAGQRDKVGAAYFQHPLRVVLPHMDKAKNDALSVWGYK